MFSMVGASHTMQFHAASYPVWQWKKWHRGSYLVCISLCVRSQLGRAANARSEGSQLEGGGREVNELALPACHSTRRGVYLLEGECCMTDHGRGMRKICARTPQ